MELHLSFLLGLLIGIFPLFTFAFSGARMQRKSTGKVFPNSVSESRTRGSNKVQESDVKTPRRMKFTSVDPSGLEKNSNDLQSIFPTLSTQQTKAPGTTVKWEKLDSPVKENKITPLKKKILTKEELENLRKANHDLLKTSSPPRLEKPHLDKNPKTDPKKVRNVVKEKAKRPKLTKSLREKTNPSSKPRNNLKEKPKVSTPKGTLTKFQTSFDEYFSAPETGKSSRFKRRFHAVRRRPSRPSYRRRRLPPRRRKDWNPPHPAERPPPIPVPVDDTDFLSSCFHSNVKRSASPKRRKRASHLHLHSGAEEEEEDYDDEDSSEVPPEVLNNMLSRDISDMGDEENNSEKELHLNLNKLHNLKSSANHGHHADLSTPRPSDYEDFLQKSPHDRKSQEEKRKRTHQDIPKGSSSSRRKLSPTAVKELANKLQQIERNMKEKEEKESEIGEDPSGPFMSHPHRITSMDIRLLQKALRNGNTNQWVERELRLIEHESRALKLKAKKLHNKLMRFHDQHKNARLSDANQQYSPGYELPYIYQSNYNDLPGEYDGFRGRNQYVPEDLRWRTQGLMMDHPPSPLNAVEGDYLRNVAMAAGRRTNYPTRVYSRMGPSHPRNIGHVLPKLQYDVVDVKQHSDRKYYLPHRQQRGYESGGDQGYYTGGHQGYDTGGRHGYDTGGHQGYDTGSGHGYETGGHQGYDTGSRHGYDTGGHHGYHTGGHNGYDTGGRHGYDTGGHHGYDTEGHQGYDTGGRHGYDTGGRHGYETGGHQGYDTGGRYGYDTGGHHGYDTRGHHGYDTGNNDGHKTQGHEGYEFGGPDDYHTGNRHSYDNGGRHGYDNRGHHGYDTGANYGYDTRGHPGYNTGGHRGYDPEDHHGYENVHYPDPRRKGPLGQARRKRDGYDYERFENRRTDSMSNNRRSFPSRDGYKQGYGQGVLGDGRYPYDRYGTTGGQVNANFHGNHNQGYRHGNNVPGRNKYPHDHFEITRGHSGEGFHGYHDQRYPYRHEPDSYKSKYPKHPHYDSMSDHDRDNQNDHHSQRYQFGHGYDTAALRNRKYPHGYRDRVTGYPRGRASDYHNQRVHLRHGHEPGYLGQGKSSQSLYNLQHSKPHTLLDADYLHHQNKESEAHPVDARSQRMHSMIHDLNVLNDLNKADDYDKDYENVEPLKSHDFDYDHGEASDKAFVASGLQEPLLKRMKRSLKTSKDSGSRQHDTATQTAKGVTGNATKAIPMMQLDKGTIKKATSKEGTGKLVSEISLLENSINPIKYTSTVESLRDKAPSNGGRAGVGFQEKKFVNLHISPSKRTWKARQWFKSRSDVLKKSSFVQPNIEHPLINDLNLKGVANKINDQFKKLLNLSSAPNSPTDVLNPKNTEKENDFRASEKNGQKVVPDINVGDSQGSKESESLHEDHMKENIHRDYPKIFDTISSTTSPTEESRVTEMNDKNPQKDRAGTVHKSSNTRTYIFNKKQRHQFLTAPLVNIRYRVLKPMWPQKGPADDERYWELDRSSAQPEVAHHPRQYLKTRHRNKEFFEIWTQRGKPNWLMDRRRHLDGIRRGSFVRNRKKLILHKSAGDPPVYQLEHLKVSPNTEIKWLKIVSRKPIRKLYKHFGSWTLMHPRLEKSEPFLADYLKKTKQSSSGSRTDLHEPEEMSGYNINSKSREPNDDLMPWVFKRQNFNLLTDDEFANLAEAIGQYSDKQSRLKRAIGKTFFKRDPVTQKELDMKQELVELLRRFPLSDSEKKLNEKLKKEDMANSHASDVGQKILELDKEDDQPFIDLEDAGDLLSGKDRIRRNAGPGKFSRALDPKPLTSKHGKTRGKSIRDKWPIASVKDNEAFEAETEIKRQRKRPKLQHDGQFHEDAIWHRQKRHHNKFQMPESDKHEYEIRTLKELLKSNMKLINSAADKFLNHHTREGSFEPYLIAYPINRKAMMGDPLSHQQKASHSRHESFREIPTDEVGEETLKDRMRSNRDDDHAYDEDRNNRIDEDIDNQDDDVDYHHDDGERGQENDEGDDHEDEEGREDEDDEDDDDRRESDNEEDDGRYDESENTDTERHSRHYRSLQDETSLKDTQKDTQYHIKPAALRLRHRRSVRGAPEDDEEDYLGDKEIDNIANKKGQGYARDKEKIDYDEAEEDSDDEEVSDDDDDDEDEDDGEADADEKDESEKDEGIKVQDKGHLSEPKDDFAYVEKDTESKKREQYSWSDWSECSVTCGIGRRFRSNICADGEPCSGKSASTEAEVCSDREEC